MQRESGTVLFSSASLYVCFVMKILNDALCLRLSFALPITALLVIIFYLWFSVSVRDAEILRLTERVIRLEGQIEMEHRMQETRIRCMTLDELSKRLGWEAGK